MKSKLDWLLTFGWLWALRERLAYQRLDRVLEKFGDDSFEGRSATTRYRRAHFANRFGRPLDPRVQSHVETLRANGIPMTDLRILVVNNVLVPEHDSVGLRHDLHYSLDRWIGWIMTAFGALVFYYAAACVIRRAEYVPLLPLLGAGVATAIGYYFLSLYSIQLHRVLRRYKHLLV